MTLRNHQVINDYKQICEQNKRVQHKVIQMVGQLETFVQKTMQLKSESKYVRPKEPDNEFYKAKQEELDDTQREITSTKRTIKNLREELEHDENFKRMIDS